MGVKRGERSQPINQILEKDRLISSFLPHPLVIVKAKAIHLLAFFIEIKILKPTLKHLFWCQRSRAEGGFESLLEHDSKAQPPLCTYSDFTHS